MSKVRHNIYEKILMTRVLLPAVLLIVFLLSQPIAAQTLSPGSLDPTFGNGGGIVTLPIDDSGTKSVAIQTDGKIVTAGGSTVVRYLRNGSLDNSFGSYGTAVAAIGIRALVIQSDGKIIAAGNTANGTNTDFGLARFNSDGSPDISFGNQGSLTTIIPRSGAHVYDSAATGIAIRNDGRIVVSGGSGYYEEDWGWVDGVIATVRYDSDGSLDTTFGVGGIVTQPSVVTYFDASAIIQTDGKIVVAGSGIFGTSTKGAVMRYNINGSLDTTFSGGIVFTPSCCQFPGATVQPDGKIIVAGTKWISPQELDFALVRFGSNGALDTSFGNGGMVTTPIGGYDAILNAIAIQTDGKIVAVGARFQPVTFYDWAVVRYNPNGSLDGSYGASGKVIIDVNGGSGYEYAHDIAFDSIGRAVVVGSVGPQGASSAVVRLIGDNAVPQLVTVAGRVTTAGGRGVQNARVTITDSLGATRTGTTSTFGYYQFDNIITGQTYTIGAASKRYSFLDRAVQVNDNLSDVDFVAIDKSTVRGE